LAEPRTVASKITVLFKPHMFGDTVPPLSAKSSSDKWLAPLVNTLAYGFGSMMVLPVIFWIIGRTDTVAYSRAFLAIFLISFVVAELSWVYEGVNLMYKYILPESMRFKNGATVSCPFFGPINLFTWDVSMAAFMYMDYEEDPTQFWPKVYLGLSVCEVIFMFFGGPCHWIAQFSWALVMLVAAMVMIGFNCSDHTFIMNFIFRIIYALNPFVNYVGYRSILEWDYIRLDPFSDDSQSIRLDEIAILKKETIEELSSEREEPIKGVPNEEPISPISIPVPKVTVDKKMKDVKSWIHDTSSCVLAVNVLSAFIGALLM